MREGLNDAEELKAQEQLDEVVPRIPCIENEDHAYAILEAKFKAKKGKRNSKLRKKKNAILRTTRRGQKPSEFGVNFDLDDASYEVYKEAKNTCNLGKQIGLYVKNDEEMVEPLAKNLKAKSAEGDQRVVKKKMEQR